MTRGVRLYLVGSFVLVALASCGRGFFSEEREPWRAEAEIACLKSGSVKEGPDLVRISPISGPGACGAEFPLKVAALGEGAGGFGFADEDLRPPGTIGNQPRWPMGQSPPPAPYSNPGTYPDPGTRPPAYGVLDTGVTPRAPLSLRAPGVASDPDDIRLPSQSAPLYPERVEMPPLPPPGAYSQPRLGPGPANFSAASQPVAIRPAATLACPIVSALDHWLADSVQPAAQRWFGARVVEIKQISAYSCRGMNGNSNARISEHAFGNAIDIAAFTLADGRQVRVKEGWRGLPEEQGFLRDIEATACQQFSTVLAPGSNAYHYDHIHLDLMRRASGRLICEPAAVSGEEVAAHAARGNPYASRGQFVTGSLGAKTTRRHRHGEKVNEEDEFEDD